MITHQAYPGVDQYTEKQKRTVQRILDSLKRNEERTGSHYKASRAHSRRLCHSVVEITLETLEGEKLTFNAYMGDVSSSGMSFVYPRELPSPDIIVGIPLGGSEKAFFNGEIVRMREFPGEEFIEYGVKFAGRLRDRNLE